MIMCMESHVVTLLRGLSKENLDCIMEGLKFALVEYKDSEKAQGFQETLTKVTSILEEYESHES